jgi:hypothetical protein
MTRLKLAFVNAVIVTGSIAIAVLQWPEAVKNSGFGSGGYNQGMVGTVLLEVLMAGIPIVLFAAATHLGLSHLLFRQGELDAYKRRKIVESVAGTDGTRTTAAPGAESANNSLN